MKNLPLKTSAVTLGKLNFLVFLFLSLVSFSDKDRADRGLVTEHAMVVSAHPLASEVGAEVLRRGGNAIDAAVAVQFALAVVYPDAGNIGGGGFMVLRQNNGGSFALDYREKAPAAAHRDLYLNEKGEVIKDLSLKGHLAAGVPGTVAGMVLAHEKFGNLSWPKLVEPAIKLAAKGFPLTPKEAGKLNGIQKELIWYNPNRPDFFLRDKWRTGDTLRLPELAQTLIRIRDKKRAGFYEGETADLIFAEMKAGGGIISKKDLSEYQAVWRKPITGQVGEYRIISMPPPSSGGIALLQLLNISEEYPLTDWGWNTPKTAHFMTEAERRVYADRASHLGDPDFYKVPVSGLLNKNYLKARMANFSVKKKTPNRQISAGNPAPPESPNTTHFSIVDAQGNAVSVTTTLNSSYGSRVVVKGAGFLLNNQMDDFSAKAGIPNAYGLVGAEANAIAPGKRMLSSMTPTILEKDGKLFMVIGAMGGSTIITTVYQIILNVTKHGFSMQAAVNAGRFHHQWKPDWILAEKGALSLGTRLRLWLKGHKIVPKKTSIGRAAGILVLPDGKLEAGADPRGDDKAAGF